MSQHRSFCRICIATCGIVVEVDDGEVVGITGDREHPISAGYVCPKGRGLADVHRSPRRLDGAYVRRGDALEATTHDAALADLGEVLRRVVAEHGTDAVGFFQGTGGYLDPAGGWAGRRLRRALDSKHTYSNATVDSVAKTIVPVLMAGTTGLVPHPDDEGRLLVFVGSNPLVSHGQSTGFPNPIEWIRGARSRGKVVVIDPRLTETARNADRHHGVRPGTDHAVLAHVVRALLADGVDRGGLEARATNVDALEAAVAPYDREHAARVTGLDAQELDELVADIREAGRVAVITGTGTTMSPGGNVVEWLAWAIMILTGSFDHAGGMWFNPGYLTRLDHRDRLPVSERSDAGPPTRPEILRLAGEWPAAVIPDEIEAGNLRVLVVLGAGLTTALPDADRVRSALAKLDALVVLEVLSTETTELATHVFACPDQLERPDLPSLDLFTNVFYSQYTPAIVEAPPSRPPMWRTVCKIGALLGVDLLGPGIDPDTVDSEDILQKVARQTDLGPLRAADGPVVEPPVYGWAESRLPKGRWDLAPELFVAQLAGLDRRPALTLTPRRQLRHMNAVHYREGDEPRVLLHPDDATANGIADGDLVEIASATGSLRLPAEVTAANARGSVSVPHGWAGSNVNQLTSRTDIDILTGMPLLSGTAVTVAVVADRDQPVGTPA